MEEYIGEQNKPSPEEKAGVGAFLHKLVGVHCVRPYSWESNFAL